MAKLSNKQKMFVKEYIIDFNGSRAAVAAGYSEKTSKEIASENLTKPNIQEAIQKAINPKLDKLDVTVENVIESILDIRTSCAADGEDGMIDAGNALRSNEMLGKYLKMFTEKIEHSGKIEMPTVVIEK